MSVTYKIDFTEFYKNIFLENEVALPNVFSTIYQFLFPATRTRGRI